MTMRAWLPAFGLLAFVACGSSSPSSPSPQPSPGPTPGPAPAPTTVTVTGRITETLTGAAVGPFSQTVDRLPALLTISAPGYITRQAYAGSAAPTVDLIKDAAPFSLDFYRQLVRNGYEAPSALQPVTVLTANPSMYVQSTGLSASNLAAMESAVRAVVPAMSGGRLSLGAFETGDAVRVPQTGWIVAEQVNEPDGTSCGRSNVGLAAGHIWFNIAPRCRFGTPNIDPGMLAHETGHALGFWHVPPGSLMGATRQFGLMTPTATERYHAAIAYSRQSGNRDPDVDAATSTPLSVRSGIVVVD